MEQLNVQIDQMLDQLKERSVDQSNADLFEIIGKLEQVKSYLLAEVVHPELHTFDSPSPSFFDNLPLQEAHEGGGEQMAQIPPAAQVGGGEQMEQIPPAAEVGGEQMELIAPAAQVGGGEQIEQIQPAAEVGVGEQMEQIPPAAEVGDEQVELIAPAAQVGGGLGWKYIWDPSDEDLFPPLTGIVPWFSTRVKSKKDHTFLDIGYQALQILAGRHPALINSAIFNQVNMPVTLKSSKLAGRSITYRTGLLIKFRQGLGLVLFWPLLGSMFPLRATIHVSFQWKAFAEKSTLLIFIEEKASDQVGTSKQATGRKRAYAD